WFGRGGGGVEKSETRARGRRGRPLHRLPAGFPHAQRRNVRKEDLIEEKDEGQRNGDRPDGGAGQESGVSAVKFAHAKRYRLRIKAPLKACNNLVSMSGPGGPEKPVR